MIKTLKKLFICSMSCLLLINNISVVHAEPLDIPPIENNEFDYKYSNSFNLIENGIGDNPLLYRPFGSDNKYLKSLNISIKDKIYYEIFKAIEFLEVSDKSVGTIYKQNIDKYKALLHSQFLNMKNPYKYALGLERHLDVESIYNVNERVMNNVQEIYDTNIDDSLYFPVLNLTVDFYSSGLFQYSFSLKNGYSSASNAGITNYNDTSLYCNSMLSLVQIMANRFNKKMPEVSLLKPVFVSNLPLYYNKSYYDLDNLNLLYKPFDLVGSYPVKSNQSFRSSFYVWSSSNLIGPGNKYRFETDNTFNYKGSLMGTFTYLSNSQCISISQIPFIWRDSYEPDPNPTPENPDPPKPIPPTPEPSPTPTNCPSFDDSNILNSMNDINSNINDKFKHLFDGDVAVNDQGDSIVENNKKINEEFKKVDNITDGFVDNLKKSDNDLKLVDNNDPNFKKSVSFISNMFEDLIKPKPIRYLVIFSLSLGIALIIIGRKKL